MTMKLTKAELGKAHDRLKSLQSRIKSVKEKAQEATDEIVGTVEVGGAAFAMGVIQGKTGGVEVIGVPLELAIGGGLVGLSIMGIAGKSSGHLANLGKGCLAAYLTTVGRGVGQQWEDKSLAAGKTPPAVTKGSNLTPEELAAAAALA